MRPRLSGPSSAKIIGGCCVCSADDAEALLSVGSWLLPTCDETRCGCVSPATLVLLMLFSGINELHSSPTLHLERFILLNSTSFSSFPSHP